MSKDLNNELNRRWETYQRFYREGAIYSAFVRLGEIANCLEHGSIPSKFISMWAEALRQVEATPNDLRSIGNEAEQQIARVRRMLHAGSDLLYEEALLVITVRTELDLLLRFLSDRGAADVPDVSSLDRALDELLREPKSSTVFCSAQAAAKKNWGLPLQSRWLSRDTMP